MKHKHKLPNRRCQILCIIIELLCKFLMSCCCFLLIVAMSAVQLDANGPWLIAWACLVAIYALANFCIDKERTLHSILHILNNTLFVVLFTWLIAFVVIQIATTVQLDVLHHFLDSAFR